MSTLEVGAEVVCVGPYDGRLTMGKVYVVDVYEPEVPEIDFGGFKWPAYVRVTDDVGRPLWCHAHRFKMP